MDHRAERNDWHVRIVTSSVITATPTHFHLSNRVTTFLGEDVYFEREFAKEIDRSSV